MGLLTRHRTTNSIYQSVKSLSCQLNSVLCPVYSSETASGLGERATERLAGGSSTPLSSRSYYDAGCVNPPASMLVRSGRVDERDYATQRSEASRRRPTIVRELLISRKSSLYAEFVRATARTMTVRLMK